MCPLASERDSHFCPDSRCSILGRIRRVALHKHAGRAGVRVDTMLFLRNVCQTTPARVSEAGRPTANAFLHGPASEDLYLVDDELNIASLQPYNESDSLSDYRVSVAWSPHAGGSRPIPSSSGLSAPPIPPRARGYRPRRRWARRSANAERTSGVNAELLTMLPTALCRKGRHP